MRVLSFSVILKSANEKHGNIFYVIREMTERGASRIFHFQYFEFFKQ